MLPPVGGTERVLEGPGRDGDIGQGRTGRKIGYQRDETADVRLSDRGGR